MRIESLLRRKGGTKVTLDGVEYHFQPGKDGREIADVADKAHIDIFAAIPHGFRLLKEPPAQSAKPAPTRLEQPAKPLDALDRADLAALYAKRFGKRPPPRLNQSKIIEALKEGAN